MAADPDTLNDLLRYDALTGEMHWRPRGPHHFASGARALTEDQLQHAADKWNDLNAGMPALTTAGPRGTLTGVVMGKTLQAHIVAYTMHWGYPPAGQIDHYDGDRTNNRIDNLRDVDRRMAAIIRRMRADPDTPVTWGMPPAKLWGLTWEYSERTDQLCQEGMATSDSSSDADTAGVETGEAPDSTPHAAPPRNVPPYNTPPVNPLARGAAGVHDTAAPVQHL